MNAQTIIKSLDYLVRMIVVFMTVITSFFLAEYYNRFELQIVGYLILGALIVIGILNLFRKKE